MWWKIWKLLCLVFKWAKLLYSKYNRVVTLCGVARHDVYDFEGGTIT